MADLFADVAGREYARSAVGGSSILFAADFSAGAYPLCGFTAAATGLGVDYSRSHLPTGGPDGGGAVQFVQLSANGNTYWGWNGPYLSHPARGVTRYYRSYLKVVGPPSGGSKHVIVGQGSDTYPPGGGGLDQRPIFSYYPTAPSVIRFTIGLGGGTDVEALGYSEDTWYALQYAVRSSSSQGANDGLFRIWVNNDTEGSPTDSATVEYFADQGGNTDYGMYINEGTGGEEIVAGFEVGTVFDPTWYARMAA